METVQVAPVGVGPDPLIRLDDGRAMLLSAAARHACTEGDAFSGRIAGTPDQSEAGTVWMWIMGARVDRYHASGALLPPADDSDSGRADELTKALIEGIEALPEAFVLYDAEDRMIICNEQYRRLYAQVADIMVPGLLFRDVVAESLDRGVFQLEEDKLTWAERRISFHQAGIGFFEQHLADGKWIQVSERRTASGGTTSIRADITVLKERERDLRAARAQAEAEIAERTQFIAKVGHELRNPLNVVFSISQLLAGETMSRQHRTMIETLFGAASAMRDVLNDILDVAAVRSGHVNIRPQVIETRRFLKEMINIARVMKGQKKIVLRSHTDRGLPLRILTDPRRLRQILLNLLGNAFKYTPSGSVAIESSVRLSPSSGPVLRIAITDSGPGIANRLKERLLAPYTRQREHVLTQSDGLGLGLAISAELARGIGAHLGVEPGARGGTCAWIEIPVKAENEMTDPLPVASLRPVVETGQSLDVLVVDDESTNLIVADAVLRRLGHRVTTTGDCRAALQLLEQNSYDAVLLDIAMPEMSGIDIARAMVADRPNAGNTAMIAMTGNVLPEDIKTYFAAGFTGFVEKPVEIYDLAEALAACRQDHGRKPLLQPTDRARFPRQEAARTFDRAALDRMVGDIGHDNVTSIISTGIETFRQTLAACDGGAGEPLVRLLHKVHSVAELLGLNELALHTTRREQRNAPAMTSLQLEILQDVLLRAIVQMESYALDLEVMARPA